jgi:hypothetical protein
MKHTTPIIAAVCALATAGRIASADTIDASAFAAHFDVTFPGYAGSAPLENFPVLVRLSVQRNGFDYSACQALGADLRFADAAGNLLPCEVDTWNPGGESLVWVKVPSLSRSTRITAYYGCANPPANTPSDVWSNGYVGVWHLGESTLPLKESSGVGTDFDTSKDNGETLGASGAVGGAVDFATGGRTGRLSADDDPDLDGFTSFSVELWSKQAAGADYQPYMLTKTATGEFAYTLYQNRGTSTTNSVFYVFSDATNNGRKNIAGDGRNLVVPAMGVWNHQAFVRDLAKGKSFSYLDGTPVPEGGKTLAAEEMVAVCDSSSPLYLGNATGNNPQAAFPGQIDELRISNVARSADWVQATHDCVADADFAAYNVGNDWARYANKFTVTFAGAPAGETLSNFPVLVKVSENNPEGFSYADCRKPNGGDLRFADANGNLLPSEVDTWNTNGVSLIWVKVPSLTSSTKISAYYGWKDAPPVDPTAVWDSNYVGIWHLGESALPLMESSGRSYGFDTSSNGQETLGATGVAGGCVDFSTGATAISNRLTAAGSAAQSGFDDFTVELWSKQASTTDYTPYFLTKVDSRQYAYLFHQQRGSSPYDVFRISTNGTDSASISGSAMVPEMDEWNYHAIARDTTDKKVYCFMNGSPAPEGGVALQSGYDATMWQSTSLLYLGNAQTTANRYGFPGKIDELRISNVARSAAWVQATHDTVTSASFAQYSATRANSGVTVIYMR